MSHPLIYARWHSMKSQGKLYAAEKSFSCNVTKVDSSRPISIVAYNTFYKNYHFQLQIGDSYFCSIPLLSHIFSCFTFFCIYVFISLFWDTYVSMLEISLGYFWSFSFVFFAKIGTFLLFVTTNQGALNKYSNPSDWTPHFWWHKHCVLRDITCKLLWVMSNVCVYVHQYNTNKISGMCVILSKNSISQTLYWSLTIHAS